mgnify:CR=1 FL=1
MANETRFKSLDRLAADPRIETVFDEGENGLCAWLKPGWNVEGCSSFRAWKVKDLLAEVKLIEKGEPY